MRRDQVDFASVEARYVEIHGRLENWARWLWGEGEGSGSSAAPMFRLYRSDNWERGAPKLGVDSHDAHRIDHAVRWLPTPNRVAVHWWYVRPVHPRRACQIVGTTLLGLDELVRDGRAMLVNRRV